MEFFTAFGPIFVAVAGGLWLLMQRDRYVFYAAISLSFLVSTVVFVCLYIWNSAFAFIEYYVNHNEIKDISKLINKMPELRSPVYWNYALGIVITIIICMVLIERTINRSHKPP